VREQFKQENLELFDPVTQESHRDKFLQQSTHNRQLQSAAMNKNPELALVNAAFG
jgi:hypothetical protein